MCARPGFLRVVHEKALCVARSLLTDDLDRVLVRSNGAVGTQAIEDTANDVGRLGDEPRVVLEARVRDVVRNADREVVPRRCRREIVEHALDHRRGELLGREAVAPADDSRHLEAALVGHRLGERRHHVLIEGLAGRTGFLGSIEHRDRLGGAGNSVQQMTRRKRPEQVDLHDAQLRAAAIQVRRWSPDGLDARAHEHDHVLGVGGAEILEQPVPASGQSGESIHRRLDDRRDHRVEGVRSSPAPGSRRPDPVRRRARRAGPDPELARDVRTPARHRSWPSRRRRRGPRSC